MATDSPVHQDRLGFLDGVQLSRQLPLSEQVYALVRKAIVLGRLAPGAPIHEPEIAARLGISRTPVREAVKKVSDEGLVEVFAQHGTFVADIRRPAVEEAYIIRIALEGESVARAAATITPRQLQDIEDIHQAHETAVRRERYDEAIARDDDLHRTIAEANGLNMLWKVVDITKAQMDRCRLQSLPDPGAGLETVAQHRAIIDALAAGDPDLARQAMLRHLSTSLANTLRYLDRSRAG
ncbi:MAG: GntR family transcriptional regulator [Rhodobacteraceae bacterium]|jgi:DNA-binding GntR family transcriptional regulator|nr:GntR family transcriptional regulator [Paracoccaceae bacterium]